MKYFYFLLFSCLVWAQIPSYYSGVDFTQSSADIKLQLSNLITTTHTTITDYSQAWDILKVTDQDPSDGTKVLLMYGYNDNDGDVTTDRSRLKDNNGGNVGQWNREHVYAKSLATPAMTDFGPGADPHMLRACDVQRNGARGNFAFSYGSGNSQNVGSAWYPGDEWKGDVARIIMYMYLRYGSQCLPNNIAAGSSNSFHPDMPDVFLTWNAEDPVSFFETNRNNYLQTQLGNRNPFIDNPFLATMIWGGPSAQNTWNLSIEDVPTEVPKFIISPNPVQNQLHISNEFEKGNIYNSDGKLIKEIANQTIEVSDLTKGVYIIQITTLEGKSVSLPFIKN